MPSTKVISNSPQGFKFEAIYPGTSQIVQTSGTSAQSSAVTGQTSIVRLHATEDTYIAFGADPTADDTSLFLPAHTTEYFGVDGGDKIAGVRVSADGTLYITEGR